MQSRARQAVSVALIWLGIALINATQNVVSLRGEGVNRPLTYYFAFTALGWLVWACATPLALRMALLFPPVRGAAARTWLAHAGACLAIGLVHAGWGMLLLMVIQPWGPDPQPRPLTTLLLGRFLSQLHINLIIYAGIVAVGYTIESRRRAAELTEQLSRAQLDALRRQLEPHFLFNTLNAIAGLVRDHRNDDAVAMIAGLSDLLRRVVDGTGRQQVPLAEEMEFLERYLEIQRARFAGRLQVSIDVPSELAAAQVPTLILQPLVENAIQHGIGQRVEGGEVRVNAVRNGVALTIRVCNEGPPLARDWKAGVGVSNSRARLANLYGDESQLTVQNCTGGVEAVLRVPYRTAAQ